jgi:hypothetical protein
MPPLLLQTLRSRWFAACLHAGLWLLVYLASSHFGGKSPALRDSVALSAPAQNPAPVAKLDKLFSPGIWPRNIADTNLPSAFFTQHFIPPPTNPPAPPTTRKIDITYLGYYQTPDAPKQVITKMADSFVVRSVGTRVTTNWFVADATALSMTLSNVAAQNTVLPLNAKKEIEVPIP